MKRILSILLIILFVSGSMFAADDDFAQDDEFYDSSFEEFDEFNEFNEFDDSAFDAEEIDDEVSPAETKAESDAKATTEVVETTTVTTSHKKIYIDKYFSWNPLLGFTLSPFDSTDLLIAAGLQLDFYKYYGYKNYGTYFKVAATNESYSYGSYEVLFGGSYRIMMFDNKVELFANLGPIVTYYVNIPETSGTDDTSLLYAGVDNAYGLRFYPFKENNQFAFDIGISGSYMWNIPFDSNASNVIASRYKVLGFFGVTYAIRGDAK